MTINENNITQNFSIKINWEGSLFCHHSLAMVNREFLTELSQNHNFDIRHVPFEPDQFTPDVNSKYELIKPMLIGKHEDATIHVRHRWPPDFSKPKNGKLVMIQPWEYGSLPVDWCKEIIQNVDEIWVYTHFLRKCYIRSGVPESKVFTVPLGIDPDLFNPDQKPYPLIKSMTDGKFSFLFNGGVTLRKGVDILVNAYLNEFRAHEKVCLVLKDSNFYGKILAARIQELSRRDDVAKIVYINTDIDHFNLPGLYTACDCYVHPYRAEGYGLPIAEALACGKPVIVTGGGSCLDFVGPEMGYFVKCSIEHMKEKKISDLETVDYPFWFVPEIGHLQKVMRYVFENQQAAKEKGLSSGKLFRLKNSWTRAAKIASDRFYYLAGVKKDCNESESKHLMLTCAIKLLKENCFKDASALFTTVLQHFGDNSISYEGLGLVAFQQKKYADSFEYFKIANRISPQEPEIILNWAEAARQLGLLSDLKNPVQVALQMKQSTIELKALLEEIETESNYPLM